MAATGPTVEELKAVLVDENQPIAKRMRTVFLLRQKGGKEAIDALAAGFVTSSVLLGHEIAFVLGQMLDPYAIPYLKKILADKTQNPIVRHEAGEALGAISDPSTLPFLEQFVNDEAIEVAETCRLAVDRIKYNMEHKEKADADSKEPLYESPYHTADPAPAYKEKDVDKLKSILCDQSRSLFERYRAMFALRNRGDKAAVEALAEGFKEPHSALLRHEIAYVMGQLRHPAAIPALRALLETEEEHPMVRHEAAEALGAIADPSCNDVLARYKADPNLIVSQSCEVALDISDYWNSDEIDGAVPVGDA